MCVPGNISGRRQAFAFPPCVRVFIFAKLGASRCSQTLPSCPKHALYHKMRAGFHEKPPTTSRSEPQSKKLRRGESTPPYTPPPALRNRDCAATSRYLHTKAPLTNLETCRDQGYKMFGGPPSNPARNKKARRPCATQARGARARPKYGRVSATANKTKSDQNTFPTSAT